MEKFEYKVVTYDTKGARIEESIDISIYKMKSRLKTDKEDLKQELLINVFKSETIVSI
mgnify:CR=1 FL=1